MQIIQSGRITVGAAFGLPFARQKTEFKMLVYNTTYRVDSADADNFLIYLHEVYMPEISKSGMLSNPRLTRILSHKDADSECFSIQYDVENSTRLHKWYVEKGDALYQDLCKAFKDKVAAFQTLMEVID